MVSVSVLAWASALTSRIDYKPNQAKQNPKRQPPPQEKLKPTKQNTLLPQVAFGHGVCHGNRELARMVILPFSSGEGLRDSTWSKWADPKPIPVLLQSSTEAKFIAPRTQSVPLYGPWLRLQSLLGPCAANVASEFLASVTGWEEVERETSSP